MVGRNAGRAFGSMLSALSMAVAGESAAPPFDPSADELAMLGLVNGHWSDRGTGDNRLIESLRRKEIKAPIPWLKLTGAAAPALPPLVFSPVLSAAARALLSQGAKPADRKLFNYAPAYSECMVSWLPHPGSRAS